MPVTMPAPGASSSYMPFAASGDSSRKATRVEQLVDALADGQLAAFAVPGDGAFVAGRTTLADAAVLARSSATSARIAAAFARASSLLGSTRVVNTAIAAMNIRAGVSARGSRVDVHRVDDVLGGVEVGRSRSPDLGRTAAGWRRRRVGVRFEPLRLPRLLTELEALDDRHESGEECLVLGRGARVDEHDQHAATGDVKKDPRLRSSIGSSPTGRSASAWAGARPFGIALDVDLLAGEATDRDIHRLGHRQNFIGARGGDHHGRRRASIVLERLASEAWGRKHRHREGVGEAL